LTLVYSAILAVGLLLFGGGLYVIFERTLLDTARSALITEGTSLDAGRILSQVNNSNAADRTNLDAPHALGIDFQIRRGNGPVLAASSALRRAPLALDPRLFARLRHGGMVGPDAIILAGHRALLLSIASFVQLPDAGAGSQQSHDGHARGPDAPKSEDLVIMQVVLSLAPQDRVLATARLALLGGGGIVILLAFGAGWVLAGTALRPISRLTRVAREIGEARGFGRRVAHQGRDDEVGRLAATFNTMLAHLHDAYEALKESYDAQRRFVSDASHELRTPLTTIRANLDLLRREPPIAEADRHEVLGDLAAESERLSRLVANLLTLARSDAGRPLRHEPVRLAPLLARIARRLAATQPGRAIGIEIPPDATALGDPDALTQVLLILLDNALKFTPSEGMVSVVAEVTDMRVSLVVRDTGVGIAPEVLPHVFERFYQGHSGMRGTSGSGLGLSIAHALVTGQGGTIAVESHLGQGSSFTITLPQLVDRPGSDPT
jgi:signal transduction histidine kinase